MFPANASHVAKDEGVLDRVPLLSPNTSTTKQPNYLSTRTEGGDYGDGDNSSDEKSSATTTKASGHQTTIWQTFVHLVKGYIGVGMLSLPWAVTQVGMTVGFLGVLLMAFWSSYNCWTVVRVKRYIDRQRAQAANAAAGNLSLGIAVTTVNDEVSETGSSVTTNTNITYPDVGEWAYGKTFQQYVR